jgi:hypothetical protein
VLGEQTVKNDSKIKSLQLSKDLLKELFLVSPDLAMRIIAKSQADS